MLRDSMVQMVLAQPSPPTASAMVGPGQSRCPLTANSYSAAVSGPAQLLLCKPTMPKTSRQRQSSQRRGSQRRSSQRRSSQRRSSQRRSSHAAPEQPAPEHPAPEQQTPQQPAPDWIATSSSDWIAVSSPDWIADLSHGVVHQMVTTGRLQAV